MSASDGALLKSAWVQPAAVHPILTLISPEIIQNAMAQLSGSIFTPVAFSFGWVAYAFKNLSLIVGDNKLMPAPDFRIIVINGKTGQSRGNFSWVLGRIVRDFDYWAPLEVKVAVRKILDEATKVDQERAAKSGKPVPPPRVRAGLCVSVFQASPVHKSGVPHADWIYYSGIATALIQLTIAAIPVILHREWAILIATAAGIVLAFATGALPDWALQKWGDFRSKKTIILTVGNGAQHAIVIIGDQDSLDLEILAALSPRFSRWTQFWTILLAILWIAHLIVLINIQNDAWFWLAIGGLGMLHNVAAAGLPRQPKALGLPLQFEECIADRKVMKTLMEVEKKYRHVGASLLKVFFPGKLYPDEAEFWRNMEAKADEEDGQKAKMNGDGQKAKMNEDAQKAKMNEATSTVPSASQVITSKAPV